MTSAMLQAKISRIILVIALVTLTLIIRLAYLQIHLMPHLLSQSKNNYLRMEKTTPLRGTILDINGIPLATNRPVTSLYWQGTGNNKLTDELLATISTIEKILDLPLTENPDFVSALKHTERCYKRLLLKSDVSFEQLSKLEEQLPNHANTKLMTEVARLYPHGSCASHILGYLGRIEVTTIGRMGLEKLFENTLKGEDGLMARTINSLGHNLTTQELKKGLAGGNIQTTLDIELQKIAEDIFPHDQAGTCIVMDPISGALRAIVSRPNFDPNIFLQPISTADWQDLQDKQALLNRAFNACYPPGSIFKLITLSTALENKLTTVDSQWHCGGYVTFANRNYWCNNKDGHGALNLHQALAQSCNIPFFKLAKHIPIDMLAEYAHHFGLGEKTNILFPEKEGLVPTNAWKKRTKGERWWPGETLSAVIGQSFLLVTPIQVARMIAGIFTGYLVTPRILINEPLTKRHLNINAETLTFLRQSMKAVVTVGTGSRLNTLKDFTIYAKTSTAQTSSLGKQDMGKAYMEHGWFVAYFSYKNTPLVLVVLAENVGSSRVSTDIARRFLIEYRKLAELRAAAAAVDTNDDTH